MPALSRMQDDHPRLCNAMYRGMEPNAIVLIPCMVGLAAVAPDLVPLAFGSKWVVAAGVLQLMAIYSLVSGLFVYCHPALLTTGAMGRYLCLHVGYAVGAAIACAVGLRFGVHAVIVALILNAAWAGLLALLFLRRLIGLSPWSYLRPAIEPGAAAGVMFALVTWARPTLNDILPLWGSVATQVALGAVVYVCILALLIPGKLVAVREIAVSAFAKPVQGNTPA